MRGVLGTWRTGIGHDELLAPTVGCVVCFLFTYLRASPTAEGMPLECSSRSAHEEVVGVVLVVKCVMIGVDVAFKLAKAVEANLPWHLGVRIRYVAVARPKPQCLTSATHPSSFPPSSCA